MSSQGLAEQRKRGVWDELLITGPKQQKMEFTDSQQKGNSSTGDLLEGRDGVRPVEVHAFLPRTTADVLSTASSGAISCELDNAGPIDGLSFPNPARKGGNPPSTIPNVQHLLSSYAITARYNVIKKKLVITMPGQSGSSDNFDSVAITQVLSLATLNGLNPGPIPNIVEAIGDRNLYNPAADWILSEPWDGFDRLPDLCRTLTHKEGFPEELKDILISKWLLSAVAAVLMPAGFRCRGVLTLQGPQGIGKTAWTKSLIGDEALSRDLIKLDHHLDAGNKDSLISAVTHWIVEIGELDGSLKKDIARLKGFLTSDRDKVRRPYGRAESEYQRRTVFCATVNDGNFLVDPTGNTRWWTLPVTKIDFSHAIDMQQVFAQLATDLKSGAQWWLSSEEEASLDKENLAHRSVSALRERILDKLDLDRPSKDRLPAMTATQLLKAIGIENPSNPQCKECGAVLREVLGDSKRINGRDKWRIPFVDNTSDFVASFNEY